MIVGIEGRRGTGLRLSLLGLDLLVAVGAAELSANPLFETLSVEGVSAVGQHFHFVILSEVGEADGAALVLESVAAI